MLTKGMFGTEFNSKSPMFGLHCGQMRARDLVHNGGWYNKAGEKLGWGDLSPDDLSRIARELPEGELFVVLPEGASYWHFVTQVGMIGSMCAVKPEADAPGVQYVAEQCRIVIKKGAILYVSSHREGPFELAEGLTVDTVTSEQVKELLERK